MVWLNRTEKKEQTHNLNLSPWAACVVACWSLVSIICTVMQLCSTSYLNHGITAPCSLKERNKLEPVNKGVESDIKSNNIKSVVQEINIGTRILLKHCCYLDLHDKHRQMVWLIELLLRVTTSTAHPVSIRLLQNLTPASLWKVAWPSLTLPATWTVIYPT